MSSRRRFLRTAGATAVVAGSAGCLEAIGGDREFTEAYDPPALLLTWQRDPTSTMTVDWHTDEAADRDAALDYRPVDGDESWQRATGETRPFHDDDPNTTYGRDVQRVELTGLRSATTHEFRVGTEPTWRFRTMPERLDGSLTFATGGDTGYGSAFGAILEAISQRDPEFLAICGDFPIADGGRQSGAGRLWEQWFDAVKNGLVTGKGRMIPVVTGVGNHECRSGYIHEASEPFEFEQTRSWREWQAPYFYSFFAFPGHPGYGVLDFGEYLSLPVLDTNHTSPIRGEQTAWLETVLAEREEIPHVFPTYHVPIYPGVEERSNESPPTQNEWPPLFEAHNIQFTFEHHRHHFKRTPPITDGELDDDGVIYMGSGNLGQMPPALVDSDRWWIDAADQSYNAHLVTIDGDTTRIETVDDGGTVIDSVERSVDGGGVRVERSPSETDA